MVFFGCLAVYLYNTFFSPSYFHKHRSWVDFLIDASDIWGATLLPAGGQCCCQAWLVTSGFFYHLSPAAPQLAVISSSGEQGRLWGVEEHGGGWQTRTAWPQLPPLTKSASPSLNSTPPQQTQSLWCLCTMHRGGGCNAKHARTGRDEVFNTEIPANPNSGRGVTFVLALQLWTAAHDVKLMSKVTLYPRSIKDNAEAKANRSSGLASSVVWSKPWRMF